MDFKRKLIHLIFPERCPYCGKLIEACEIACDTCREELIRKHVPIRKGVQGCRCISSFVYDGKVRRVILWLKYQDGVQFAAQIAVVLAQDIKDAYGDHAFDLITAVPMFKKDQMERGYNQSEILARELGKLLELPYLDTLKKIKRTRKQHKLTYSERKINLSGAFAPIDEAAVRDKRILIIDDIITSGYTLGTCCRVLSRCKPSLLCCATIASAENKYPESTVI